MIEYLQDTYTIRALDQSLPIRKSLSKFSYVKSKVYLASSTLISLVETIEKLAKACFYYLKSQQNQADQYFLKAKTSFFGGKIAFLGLFNIEKASQKRKSIEQQFDMLWKKPSPQEKPLAITQHLKTFEKRLKDHFIDPILKPPSNNSVNLSKRFQILKTLYSIALDIDLALNPLTFTKDPYQKYLIHLENKKRLQQFSDNYFTKNIQPIPFETEKLKEFFIEEMKKTTNAFIKEIEKQSNQITWLNQIRDKIYFNCKKKELLSEIQELFKQCIEKVKEEKDVKVKETLFWNFSFSIIQINLKNTVEDILKTFAEDSNNILKTINTLTNLSEEIFLSPSQKQKLPLPQEFSVKWLLNLEN